MKTQKNAFRTTSYPFYFNLDKALIAFANFRQKPEAI